MDPVVLSGIMKGVGFLISGIAAKNQARLDAFNIGTEEVMLKADGLRQSRLVMEQFEDIMKSNLAYAMSVQNRKITPDLQAAFRSDEEKTEAAISDIDFMTYINQLGLKQEAAATKRKGMDQFRASLFSAGQTGIETYYDYQDTKKGTLLRGGGGK